MKLDCNVVRDLYVLYKENDLSKKVKDTVDEHLKECNECRKIYENETDFPDIATVRDNNIKPSKKTDEKVMMNIKMTRLKIITLFILVIFIITQFQGYVFSRKNLRSDLQRSAHEINQMSLKVDNVKSDYTGWNFYQNLDRLNDVRNILYRNLNFIEKKKLKDTSEFMFIDFKSAKFLDVLQKRYINNKFTERDKIACDTMKTYLEDLLRLVEEESHRLGGIYLSHSEGSFLKALFIPIKVREISDLCHKINQLSMIYTKYNKFPDEIKLIDKDKLREKVKNVFDEQDIKVEFPEWADQSLVINTTYEFKVNNKDGDEINSGRIDAYTGNITTIGEYAHKAQLEGEMLPLGDVKKELIDILERIYGEKYNYDINYLGINKNFSSNRNIKLYSFRIYKKIDNFKINYPVRINMDARSGKIYNLYYEHNTYNYSDNIVKTDIKIDKVEALKKANINKENIDKFKFSETVIIKSVLSGEYELVHLFETDKEKIYINAINGNKEAIY